MEKGKGFPIVGIGASSGALEAFRLFLKHTPADTGMAFVLVTHLDLGQDNILAESLSEDSLLPIIPIQQAICIKPDTVYLCPPNEHLRIHQGELRLSPNSRRTDLRLNIDAFLRSLAEDQQEYAAGVVLTGKGQDGAEGLKAIRDHGGLTLVQDPTTAEFDGMPNAVLMFGAADKVVGIEDMPAYLVNYARHPYLNPSRTHAKASLIQEDIGPILDIIRARLQYDFRFYRPAMLQRRISRRMSLLNEQSIQAYAALLRDDPKEYQALVQDFLIGVTQFFRDKDAFESLRAEAIGPLVTNASAHQSLLRVWAPGCSSGEEAYTLAILFLEEMESQNRYSELQIFASDIDERSLEKARAGLYPHCISEHLPAEYLSRYFDPVDGKFKVKDSLRKKVLFAKHDLISDPPFSRMDMICCRNLLIYLDSRIQEKIFPVFHFSLKDNGYLFLGPSENLSKGSGFRELNKKWRIYRHNANHSRNKVDLSLLSHGLSSSAKTPGNREREWPQRKSFADIANRWIAETYAPPTVVIDEAYECKYTCGAIEHFVGLPTGEPNFNLMQMLREGLATRTRALVQRAAADHKTVHTGMARLRRDGHYVPVEIEVRAISAASDAENHFAVVFREQDSAGKTPQKSGKGNTKEDSSDVFVQQLEEELKNTKDDLQSTIEEFQTSNEGLKAANEEVTSVNEELQSSNEELETSREELQSLNEELSAVNSQLQDKIRELECSNNDITNLLNSTQMATLFLDGNLRIKRYTPATTAMFSLLPTDLNRPISDFNRHFSDKNLLRDAEAVLDSLTPYERQVKDKQGKEYIRRILPYRTKDNKIDGVVVTFTDITPLAQSEHLATSRLTELEAVYHGAPVGLAYLDAEQRIIRANRHLAELCGMEHTVLSGKLFTDVLPHTMAAYGEEHVEQVLETGAAITDIELRGKTPAYSRAVKDWLVSYYPVKDAHGNVAAISYVVIDNSTQKNIERRLIAEAHVARVLAEAEYFDEAIVPIMEALSDNFFADICEYWQPVVGEDGLKCTHFTAPGIPENTEKLKAIFDDTLLPLSDNLIGRAFRQGAPRCIDDADYNQGFIRHREAGYLGLKTGYALPVTTQRGVVGVMGFFTRERHHEDDYMLSLLTRLGRDCGEFYGRIQAEAALRESDRRKNDFLSLLGHELRNPLAAIGTVVELIKNGERDMAVFQHILGNSVNSMAYLLDDLLDLDRITQGTLSLRAEPCNLVEVATAACDAIGMKIQQNNQQLEFVAPKDAIVVEGDPVRLQQVIANLLVNAVRFSHRGSTITLSLTTAGDEVQIDVADSGVGFGAADAERLFQPFEQLNQKAQAKGGLGLGLALVKQIVELHKGRVSAFSAGKNCGATFTVTLPCVQVDQPQQLLDKPKEDSDADEGEELRAGLRVLLVEDNEDTGRGMAQILQHMGCKATLATCGEAALQIAKTFVPEVCIVDLDLPDMSGYELAQKIQSELASNPPAQMCLTGYGHTEARERAKEAGFQYHMSKPADMQVLKQRLIQMQNQTSKQAVK